MRDKPAPCVDEEGCCPHGFFEPESGDCPQCDYATLREVIRALTRALTLAVGEERAAAELEKVYRQL
jgi:hypothetical protein